MNLFRGRDFLNPLGSLLPELSELPNEDGKFRPHLGHLITLFSFYILFLNNLPSNMEGINIRENSYAASY